MKRGKITITANGTVAVPSAVKMNIYEIANLFGIFYQTARVAVRAIEKSNVACGDNSIGGTVEGMRVYADYYGLDMVVTVAFRVQLPQAEIFRRWVIAQIVKPDKQPILLQYNNSTSICQRK